jgi:hypothetical protein
MVCQGILCKIRAKELKASQITNSSTSLKMHMISKTSNTAMLFVIPFQIVGTFSVFSYSEERPEIPFHMSVSKMMSP